MVYQEKKFDLPTLQDLSKESVEAHLGLYVGYVKNFNALQAVQQELLKDPEKNAHALSEIVRRLAFEWNGMRLHEYYFSQWEQGPTPLITNEALGTAIAQQFGTYGSWEAQFKSIALMRGVGWAILYFDPTAGVFHNAWVGEHMQGHFATLPIILALDMWEHAFVAQYGTTGKKPYIDVCFKNYNWAVMERRFSDIAK